MNEMKNNPNVEWIKKRKEILQNIEKFTLKGDRIQAHHKKSWNDYPDLRYEMRNGITLCIPCHKKVHRRKSLCLRLAASV